jgi:hypothetical protein
MLTLSLGQDAFVGWVGTLLGSALGGVIAVLVTLLSLRQQRKDTLAAAQHERMIAAAAAWAAAVLQLPSVVTRGSWTNCLQAQFDVMAEVQRLNMELSGEHPEFCNCLIKISGQLLEEAEDLIAASPFRRLPRRVTPKLMPFAARLGGIVNLVTTWVAQPAKQAGLLAELREQLAGKSR